MKKALVDLFSSKKFIVLLATIAAYITAKIGWNVPEAEAEKVLLLVGTWLGVQGLTDIGKSKAEIDSAATTAAVAKMSAAASPPVAPADAPASP